MKVKKRMQFRFISKVILAALNVDDTGSVNLVIFRFTHTTFSTVWLLCTRYDKTKETTVDFVETNNNETDYHIYHDHIINMHIPVDRKWSDRTIKCKGT